MRMEIYYEFAKKKDKRVCRSINLIKSSFYELLKEVPLNKITVMDICKHTDINRCTFYAHFENLDALLDDLQTELTEMFIQALSLYNYDKNSHATVDALFDCIRKNPELFSLSNRLSSKGNVHPMIEKVIIKRTLPEWLNKSTISTEQAVLLEAYVASGGRRILEMWYDSGFTLNENMVKNVFENVIKHGLYHFVYTK